jgi:hypothetical protein
MSAEATSATETATSTAKEPNLALVGVRDLGIVLAILSLWAAADTWYVVTGLGLAAWVSVLNGLLAGAAITGLLHEWGHFAGARLSGGTAPLAPAKSFLPLFNFDFSKSETSHFQAMSVGGNLPTWGFALLLAMALPLDAPGRIAIVSSAVGFSIFALIVEAPVMSRVAGGMAPAESLGKITASTIRSGAIGGAVGALLIASML